MAKLTVKLKQHTPLIHFQHEQDGATLRATELKPKLDKFLTEHAFDNDYEEYKKYLIGDVKKYKKLKNNDEDKGKLNPAFDYKVRIISVGKTSKTKLNKFPLYFGDMEKDINEEKIEKYYVKNSGIIEIEFFSFQEKIIEDIKKNLVSFLLVTNLGTRQSKGFGGFFIHEEDILFKEQVGNKEKYVDMLKKVKEKFLYLKLSEKYNDRKKFEIVDILYKLMKSGVNYPDFKKDKGKTYHQSFMFKYFLDDEIGNEKRYIKESFFYPNVRIQNDNKEKKYVRALLGVNESIEFKDKERRGKVIYNSNEVERFKSPITFKIIDDYIFLLPEKELELIKGKKFTLHQEGFDRNKKTIYVPADFEIEDFLFDFADYINNDITSDENKSNIFEKQISELEKHILIKVGEANA